MGHFGNQVFDHQGGESARYQRQQGGLEALFGPFLGSIFDHEDDDSAWYQPRQVAFLGSIFDHEDGESAWYQPHQGGLAAFWVILGVKFLIIKVVNLLGISTNRVD